MVETKPLGFEILRDEGNAVAANYGLRYVLPPQLKELYLRFPLDLAATNGEDSWTLAMPARYVIDRDGVVRWADVSADYTRRPEVAPTLAAVRELNS